MEFTTLTQTLSNFLSVFSLGYGNLLPSTLWLFGTLLSIEIVLFGIWYAFGAENIVGAMKKILFVGFWFWIVTSFPTLANSLVDSLIQAGQIAAGGKAINLLDPSALASYGLTAAEPIIKYMNLTASFELGKMAILGILWLIVLAIFMLLAIQVFLSVLEFYAVVAFVSILLPFALNRYTKFLAEKAIGAVIAFGIKLMVLSFILSIAHPVLSAATLGANPTYNQILGLILTTGAIALLAWNVPGLVAGLLSGSPSLSAGTAMQNTLAGAAIGGAGAVALYDSTRRAALPTMAAARLAAAGAGAATAGAGLALTDTSGLGRMEALGRGGAGAVRGVGTALTASLSGLGAQAAASTGLGQAFDAGKRAASGLGGAGARPAAGGSAGEAPTRRPRFTRSALQRLRSAQTMIPTEARPHGGSPNLSL
jgi:type IV secretion system protein TrbL